MNAPHQVATTDGTRIDLGKGRSLAIGREAGAEPVTISSPAPSSIEEGEILHLLAADAVEPPPHPLIPASLRVTAENLAVVRNSIAEIGQQTPIVLWIDPDGQSYVLDGRTRLAACRELGIPTKYSTLCTDELKDHTLRSWIICRHAANGATRRLSHVDQAFLAAALCKEYEGAAKQRQHHCPEAADQETGKSHELAAYKMNLTPNAVRQARAVIDDAELSALVRAERLPLSTAASIARGKPEKRERQLQQALKASFARNQARWRRERMKLAKRLLGLVKDAKRIGGPATWGLAQISQDLAAIAHQVEQSVPAALCGDCAGKGCPGCQSRGWLTTHECEERGRAAEPPLPELATTDGPGSSA